MSDPTQPQPAASSPADRAIATARALSVVVELVHTDPVLRVLALGHPSYWLDGGQVEVHFFRVLRNAAEVLAAAKAFFGGEIAIEPHYSRDTEKHTLTTTWQGVPLVVKVPVQREDELEALRKRVAEIEAEERLRAGRLAEQRHQVEDEAAPAAYAAVTE